MPSVLYIFWNLNSSTITLIRTTTTPFTLLPIIESKQPPNPFVATFPVIYENIIATVLLTPSVARQDGAWHHLKVPFRFPPIILPTLLSSARQADVTLAQDLTNPEFQSNQKPRKKKKTLYPDCASNEQPCPKSWWLGKAFSIFFFLNNLSERGDQEPGIFSRAGNYNVGIIQQDRDDFIMWNPS